MQVRIVYLQLPPSHAGSREEKLDDKFLATDREIRTKWESKFTVSLTGSALRTRQVATHPLSGGAAPLDGRLPLVGLGPPHGVLGRVSVPRPDDGHRSAVRVFLAFDRLIVHHTLLINLQFSDMNFGFLLFVRWGRGRPLDFTDSDDSGATVFTADSERLVCLSFLQFGNRRGWGWSWDRHCQWLSAVRSCGWLSVLVGRWWWRWRWGRGRGHLGQSVPPRDVLHLIVELDFGVIHSVTIHLCSASSVQSWGKLLRNSLFVFSFQSPDPSWSCVVDLSSSRLVGRSRHFWLRRNCRGHGTRTCWTQLKLQCVSDQGR